MNPTRLFVGNLSYQTGENDLRDYFAQAGAVTSVNLMLDKATGKSRGFAFVEFATPEEAQKAIEQFHNKDFQGRARNARRAGVADAVNGRRAVDPRHHFGNRAGFGRPGFPFRIKFDSRRPPSILNHQHYG